MVEPTHAPASGATQSRVCVVGSGPAGLVLALELARLGCEVTLVESGVEKPSREAQDLSDAGLDVATTHAPMSDAVHRRWGGTSHLWGGRCVPYDPVDFESRPGLREGWPIDHATIAQHYASACEYADCGPATFRLQQAYGPVPVRPISDRFVGGDLNADELERWCSLSVLVDRLGPRIERHSRISRLLGRTCVGLEASDDGRLVRAVHLAATADPTAPPLRLESDFVVLACGGVETTRLLLHVARQAQPPRIDGRAFLGRGYMGHLSGKIARVRLAGDPRRTVHDFERIEGHYVRRRFTFTSAALRERRLLNIAMWLDNPPPADPSHGSGILSAAYLAMRTPIIGGRLAPNAIRQSLLRQGARPELGPHLINVARRLPSTLAFVANFTRKRYFERPRLPGFFAYSPANVYALHFHAEQTPNEASRITLDPEAVDALGVPRARLALRFDRKDATSVVAAHRAVDEHLQTHGIGRLEYLVPEADRVDAVLQQARDGFHQIGATRMAEGPEAGVVDTQGRVFGTENLYVCSSAAFPTSGQANPTLTILAFAIRLAAHLAATVPAR